MLAAIVWAKLSAQHTHTEIDEHFKIKSNMEKAMLSGFANRK